MIKNRGRAVIVALAVPATFAAGGIAAAASNHPVRPDWVNDRGVVQVDKIPGDVPVLDHAGQLVRNSHGNLTMHRSGGSQPPPKPQP